MPFIAVALVAWHFYGDTLSFVQPEGLESMFPLRVIDYLRGEERVISGLVGGLAMTYCLFVLNAKYKFLQQTTALPSLIYLFLIAWLLPVYGVDYLFIASLLLMIGFGELQGAILKTQFNTTLFNFGFLVSSAIVVYPKFVLLFLWAVCAMFVSGRSTVRDVMALLLGFVTVLFFALFGYWWMGNWSDFVPVFKNILLSGEFVETFSKKELVGAGILSFLLLLSLLKVIGYNSLFVVNQRRGMLSLLFLFFFLSLTIFIIPGIQPNILYLLACPIAYFYAQYFILKRTGWVSDLFFILFLFSCLLSLF
ncbi:hypothetical protein [Odoribacter lunatus]|uniref:hypothetical protein n=1 Tax=Odoribacter lunatus TaxID=2941335 RepID=UPI00203FAC9D|nr:hypothetical protein [Odoribacter lunatus]